MADLWIKSQGRNALLKTSVLYVDMDEDTNSFNIISETSRSEYILAHYATEERALEVLDEIQKVLFDKEILRFYNCEVTEKDIDQLGISRAILLRDDSGISKCDFISPNTIVFEMPKE